MLIYVFMLIYVIYYKILHNLIDLEISDFFQMRNSVSTRGHTLTICKPIMSTDADKYKFCNRAVSAWNNLPSNVVLANNFVSFKKRLNKVDLTEFTLCLTG